MKLIDGKFYENGEEVPLEIGNWAQINLLKEKAKQLEKGTKVDVIIKSTYRLSVEFECPLCCKVNTIEDAEEYEDFEPDDNDVELLCDAEICQCDYCLGDIKLKVEKSDEKFRNVKFFVKPA
jgi:hypothetical protein